jgi:hypothetical protein
MIATPTTWNFDLDQRLALPSGYRGTVTRRIESLSKAGEVQRIYTLRVVRGDGKVVSTEVGEQNLRAA